jgi:hypothetical protein
MSESRMQDQIASMTKIIPSCPVSERVESDFWGGMRARAPQLVRTEPFAPVISPLHTVTKALLAAQQATDLCSRQAEQIRNLRAALQGQIAGNDALRKTISDQADTIAEQFDLVMSYEAHINELEDMEGDAE